MVSILIINYKTYELTKNAVNSIVKHTSDVEYEIILLDNASSDGSIEKLAIHFKNIIDVGLLKIIANPINGGFSYGNNIGIDHAKGDLIVLVNSDIEINNDIIGNIVKFFKDKSEPQILGPKIVLPNGNFEHGSKRGFPAPLNSLLYLLKLDEKIKLKSTNSYRMKELGIDQVGKVDAISGSFFVIPRTIIDKIGKLDETFFMYGEDIDWCYRAKMAGFQVVYNPELGTVTHYHGQSGLKKNKRIIWEFHRAMFIFHNKHYKAKYNFIINLVVYIGIYSKYLLKVIKNMFIRG